MILMENVLCARDHARNCVCGEEISPRPTTKAEKDKCYEGNTAGGGLRVTGRGQGGLLEEVTET